MVLVLVDAYWGEPKASLLTEIRLNEALLGGTVVDRRRLGWTTAKPQPKAPASSARADSRLRLVTGDATSRRRPEKYP
jgi:hypothetical protein